MEDYIYILLGVVWIIYAVYRANQKKKAKQRTPETEPTSGSETQNEMRSLLEGILTGEVTNAPKPSSYIDESLSAITEVQPEYENVDIKTDYKLDTIPIEERERLVEDEYLELSFSQIFNNEDSEQELEREDIDFDLRKAIIYSEILNRPYM